MRVPNMRWNRRHNLATLTVSFGRIWHRTELLDDLVLGYNATGRLARILVLDPGRLLPPGADERAALEAVRRLCDGRARPADLDVIDSAIARCSVGL